ncbi:MAG: hypothetical protein ABII72_04465 [Parcubacteria group bacterium]
MANCLDRKLRGIIERNKFDICALGVVTAKVTEEVEKAVAGVMGAKVSITLEIGVDHEKHSSLDLRIVVLAVRFFGKRKKTFHLEVIETLAGKATVDDEEVERTSPRLQRVAAG